MFFLRMLLAAARSLRANFLRSILAILGIVIGVGTVIAAVGVIEGATRDFMADMKKVGSDVMWVTPGNIRLGGVAFAGGQRLWLDDVEDILNEPAVAVAAPEIHSPAQIKFASKNEVALVIGARPEFFDVFSYHAHKGRLFGRSDDVGRRRVVALGYDLADKLFEGRDPIGEMVRVGRESFTVVAVMKEKGIVGYSNFDDHVYITLSRAESMFNRHSLTRISIRGADSDDQDAARSAIAGVLRRKHRLQLGEDDDFNITSPKELFETFSKVVGMWQAVFFAISGISLVVGGFGIMNIMLVSVTERTREIGVRMAVGAYRSDILIQFLGESSMMCVVGAPLGIGLGWMIHRIVEARLAPLKPIIAPDVVLIAVGVAIATGVISGLYPAWRASRLDPVEALRYE